MEPTVPVHVLTSLATISEQESQIGPGWIIGASICEFGLQLNVHNTHTRTSAAHVFRWAEVNEALPDLWREQIVSIKEHLK